MNKHLTILATLALVCALTLATACKSDSPLKLTKVTIQKTALFDELGIADRINNEAIAKEGITLLDSLLVYNGEGRLVKKVGEASDNLNPSVFDLEDLPDGHYTLVAWQSAETNKEKTLGDCWVVKDEELLSKVSITTPYAIYSYPFALGYAVAEIDVNGGTINVDMAPKSTGCIVEVWVDHFTEDSGLVRMILETTEKGRCSGIRLDPSLKESDRWIFNEEKYGGFGKIEAGEERELFFSLVYKSPISLDFWADQKDGEGNVQNYWYGTMPNRTMQFNGHYIGYIDLARFWQVPFFGTPEDFAPWKADRDADLLVLDPLVKWGSNLAEVEQYMQSLNRYYETGDLTPQSTGTWMKSYSMDGVMSQEYFFATEEGQNLTEICCYFYDAGLPVEMIRKTLLHQGYTFKGQTHFPNQELCDVYLSSDAKTQVLVYPWSDGTLDILYQPAKLESLQFIEGMTNPAYRVRRPACRSYKAQTGRTGIPSHRS